MGVGPHPHALRDAEIAALGARADALGLGMFHAPATDRDDASGHCASADAASIAMMPWTAFVG